MNSRESARFDAFKGASSFGLNNVNDFKPASGTTKTKAQELFEALGAVADGEVATADTTPEIMDNFRMPHGTNDTVIVARARAFADAAGPLKAKFVALEHSADFIEALRQRVVDFENAHTEQNTGLQDQVGATAGIDDLIDQGLVILKQLDAIMHNKYASNPQKLAAWLTASNIQRPSANGKAATASPDVTPSPNAKQPRPVPLPMPAMVGQPVATI